MKRLPAPEIAVAEDKTSTPFPVVIAFPVNLATAPCVVAVVDTSNVPPV